MKANPLKRAVVRACSDKVYRQLLLTDPKKALADEGLIVPDAVSIVIHESSDDKLHVVLPAVGDQVPEAQQVVPSGPVVDAPENIQMVWDRQCLRVTGRIDSNTADALQQQLTGVFVDVDVDLSQVRFLSSRGLSALLTGLKHLADHEAEMRLLNVPEEIYNVLEMSGFVNLFEIVDENDPSVEAGLAGGDWFLIP